MVTEKQRKKTVAFVNCFDFYSIVIPTKKTNGFAWTINRGTYKDIMKSLDRVIKETDRKHTIHVYGCFDCNEQRILGVY